MNAINKLLSSFSTVSKAIRKKNLRIEVIFE